MQLKNKVALITGGAHGIGKEIALTFAREGGKVVIADRDFVEAKKTADKIFENNGESMPLKMDVTNESDVENGVAEIIKNMGEIDILVSNAGTQHTDPVDKFSLKDWKNLLAIHLDGAFLTTRACLQSMYRSGRGGSIIYMGSVHSKEASPFKAPYVTAKHGLIGLCKVVAKEGAGYNVRANVICPGYVDTALVQKQISEQARALGLSEEEVVSTVLLKNTVDGKFTTAKNIANVALFLASFEDNALTGQSIVVSHGWFMQ